MRKILIGALALAIAAVGRAPASASEIVQTLTFGPQTFEFPTRLTAFSRRDTDTRNVNYDFARFDPALGELTDVTVRLETETSATFEGTILVPGIAGVNANIDARYALSPPGAPEPLRCNNFFNQSGTFTPQQPTVVFGFGGPQACGAGPVTLPESALGPYQGAGTVRLPLRIDFVQEATVSNTGMTFQFTATPRATVTLTYQFTPTCPADFDGSGAVTSDDYFAFLAAFLAGEPRGDFDDDGEIDSDDYYGFLAAYFAGC